jgi:hypothetical protein
MSSRRPSTNVARIAFRVIRNLNNIGIKPVLYGSLGVALLLGEQMMIEDIDFILSDVDFVTHWNEVRKLVTRKLRYKIDPKHSREFIGTVPISFMAARDIRKLAHIDMRQTIKTCKAGAIFRNLTPRQHLLIYRKGLQRNRYRTQYKRISDKAKIHLLRRFLNDGAGQ